MLNLFDDRTPALLAEALDQTHNTLDGIGYRRFRADHPTDLERLDELARKNLLNVDDVHDTFRVGFMGLYFVEGATCNALLADINRILDLLREKYRQTSEQPVTLAVIAETLKLERSRVECCIDYIRKALTIAGTTDLKDPNAVAVPSEFLLQQGKFEEVLAERARSWFPALFKKEKTGSTNGNIEPTLIECKTYRLCGHSRSDPRTYRSKEEEAEWQQLDPIPRFGQQLVTRGLCTPERLQELEQAVEQTLDEAIAFAESSPEPELAELYTHVFKE